MLPGLEIATAGLLWLASGAVDCHVPKAPTVTVTPITKPIEYEFNYSSADLSRVKSDTISPYAPGTDTTTGGLRHDQPMTKLLVSIGYREYSSGVVCLWYDSVSYDIELKPKIYIAKEYPSGKCRTAILEHEKKHVLVDRQVINQYAQDIGRTLQKAVNAAGAIGPYPTSDLEEAKTLLISHLETAVASHKLLLEAEMRRQQAAVDSLDEYTKISKICRKEGR